MIKNLHFLFYRSLFIGLFFLFIIVGNAQSIWTNPITDANPSASNPYTTGDVRDANITVSGIRRGIGITANAGLNRYNADNWNSAAINLIDYFDFEITPAPGFLLSFVSFVYTGQASSTGPTNFAFRSSLDGYLADIGTPTAGGTTINLSAAAYQNLSSNITFRIYGWGASAATGTFSINDFTFNGTVISTNTITVSVISPTSFSLPDCATPAPITNIGFSGTGTFAAGNIFTAQLSNASGSFASPVNIGTLSLNGLDPSGSITNAAIPAGTLSGTGYLIRVVSNSPVATGSPFGTPITVTQSGYCGTNSTDYFRSRATGAWNTAATWESSPNFSFSPVITATLVPTSAASSITILNSHNVTIAAAASADQLVINLGGTLTQNTGITFTLNDGAGDDMIISGTYSFNGTSPAGLGNYVVKENGIIKATGNTGGISDNVAMSSNTRATFETNSIFEWNTNAAFSTANITYFPNTIFIPIFKITGPVPSAGGDGPTVFNGLFKLSGFNISLQGVGTKTFRNGINVGSSILSMAANSGPFQITGIGVLIGPGTISLNTNTLDITSAADIQMGSNIIINQGTSSTFNVSGILRTGAYQISGSVPINILNGGSLYTENTNGLSNTGTFASTGTNILSFGSTIYYSKSGGDQQFTQRTDYSNVTISGGGTKTLNGVSTISGILTLTSGLVTTTSSNMLNLSSTATCPGGGNATSFINGPMQKTGNSNFTFPVGQLVFSTPHYRAIGIVFPSSGAGLTTQVFTTQFRRADSYTQGGLTAAAVSTGLQRVSRCEYWDLTRSSGAENVGVILSWQAQSRCNVGNYVTDLSSLVVVQYNGTGWGDLFGRSITTGTATVGSITWLGAVLYNKFTLGSTNASQNPLPFALTTFTATPKQNTVAVYWKVANNHEQQEYVLERSTDAIDFRTIKNVTAKANSVLADYNYTDEQPFTGWNYYRLRAKDHQNNTQTSSIIKVWMGRGAIVSLFPNPASEKIVINLSEPSSINQIQLVNTAGQVLQQLNTIQFLNEINISELQAGIYYIRFHGKNGLITKSFVKH